MTDAAPQDPLRPWLLAAVTALYVARPLLTSESAAETGDGMPFVMLALALAGLWTVRAASRGGLRFVPTGPISRWGFSCCCTRLRAVVALKRVRRDRP